MRQSLDLPALSYVTSTGQPAQASLVWTAALLGYVCLCLLFWGPTEGQQTEFLQIIKKCL